MCPSGHVEEGESLEAALKREMKEELGIVVRKSKRIFMIDDIDPFSGLEQDSACANCRKTSRQAERDEYNMKF